MSEKDVDIVRTTTWSAGAGCHGGCGVLAHIKDGKLIKIEGDPEHPWNQGRICARCLAMTQYVYHPDRLQRPLKRTGKRGEDKWQEITWDEAFDFVEKKMKGIREKYGAESMVFIQGTGRDIGGWQSMLAHAYGSPNWFFGLSGVACYTPRLMVMWSQQGDFCVADASQWLPKRYDDPDYRVPECIIVWGQNLPASCPDAFFSHWLVDLMKRGSKLVVIDPRFTWLAARSEMWLQLRPGTDAALALAFANVIINEKLYDEDFVKKWTNGHFLVRTDKGKKSLVRESDIVNGGDKNKFVVWDTTGNKPIIWDSSRAEYESGDVKPAFEGEYKLTLSNGEIAVCKTVWTLYLERLSEYTPQRASEITWVPADKIIEAARFYARSKPAAIHWGLPIDTQTSTTPTAQSIANLWVLSGML
ncbi:MAG TPA: molybdopterin-dependent oxidoreductase, partial [Dehalococcoidia bacterium]|nr:molybdopterin-dependent oxidoreductase [Dehalococcoidia bacterium]